MKLKFLIVLVTFCTPILAESQVRVRYHTKVNRITSLSKTETVPNNVYDENGEIVSSDPVTLSQIGGKIAFSLYSLVIANDTTATIIEEHSKTKGVRINTTDSIVYKNRVWTAYKNGNVIIEDPVSFEFELQEGTKSILGFKCSMYLTKNPITGDVLIFWVTNQLPARLSPLQRVSAPGAVLEIFEIKGAWFCTAVEIF